VYDLPSLSQHVIFTPKPIRPVNPIFFHRLTDFRVSISSIPVHQLYKIYTDAIPPNDAPFFFTRHNALFFKQLISLRNSEILVAWRLKRQMHQPRMLSINFLEEES